MFSNAPAHYAAAVLNALGIADLFDDVLSIEHTQYRPKPDSFGFLRLFRRNRVRPDRCVMVEDTLANLKTAKKLGMATPNIGLLTNIICCPGGDFCSLANAKSIPVAQAIQERFDDLDYLHDIGEVDLNISGCMNACGHHHVGNIGVLGVDKKGEEFYQVTLGGSSDRQTALGKVIGPSFARTEVPGVVEKLIELYLEKRDSPEERFIDVVERIGIDPFKKHVYGDSDKKQAHRNRQLATA